MPRTKREEKGNSVVVLGHDERDPGSGSQPVLERDVNVPPTKESGTERAAWHDALLEANRLVTQKNLGRQDYFLNRVEDRLDDACLGVRDLIAELDALREAIEFDAALAATKAGLGASEWDAFVGARTWEVLNPDRPE